MTDGICSLRGTQNGNSDRVPRSNEVCCWQENMVDFVSDGPSGKQVKCGICIYNGLISGRLNDLIDENERALLARLPAIHTSLLHFPGFRFVTVKAALTSYTSQKQATFSGITSNFTGHTVFAPDALPACSCGYDCMRSRLAAMDASPA